MSCPVCLEDFTDPIVLPCGHSLCQGWCSSSLIDNHKITCPKCRSTHWLPEGEELPKNYDLLEILKEKKLSELPLKCETHPNETYTMFCTLCFVPVCIKCYISFGPIVITGDGIPAHKDHQVIPLDKKDTYVQDLALVTSSYLKFKKQEEMTYLEQLLETDETLQEVVKNKCDIIRNKTERLKQILDKNSQHHIESLEKCTIKTDISETSDQSVLRLQLYSNLLDQCQSLSQSDIPKSSDDIIKFLQSVESIPDCDLRPDPKCYLQRNITVQPDTDGSEAVITALRQCYSGKPVGIPSTPKIEVEDCVVNGESISVTWTYEPSDKVGYFTVYYQTAIFAHGKCSDQTSIIVPDFGRTTGHVTVRDLQSDSRYRLCITANNEVGESSRSELLYFKASIVDPEMQLF